MWNTQTGHDYMRLIDEKNVGWRNEAMVRHYKKLQQIKDTAPKPSNINERFIHKMKSGKPPSRHHKEQAKKIKDDNLKLVKALEDISKTWSK